MTYFTLPRSPARWRIKAERSGLHTLEMTESEYARTSTQRQLTYSIYAIHPDEARYGIYGPVPTCEAESVTQRRARGALVTEGFIPS